MLEELRHYDYPRVSIYEDTWEFGTTSRGTYLIPHELVPILKTMRPKGFTLAEAYLKKLDGKEYLIFVSVNKEEVVKSRLVSDQKIMAAFKEWLN